MKKFLRLSALFGIVGLGGLLLLLSWDGRAAAPAQKIYWADRTNQSVMRANLDGSEVETLWRPDSGYDWQPIGVQVDPVHQRLYWINWSLGGGREIVQADINGTNVISVTRGVHFTSLALDSVSQQLYWSGNIWDGNEIGRVNLDGSGQHGRHILVADGPTDPTGVELDTIRDKVYWSSLSTLYRSNLDGTGVEWLGGMLAYDFALDLERGKLYSTGYLGNPLDCWIIRRNFDGSEVEYLLAIGDVRPQGITIDPVAEKIYWAETGSARRIRRANMDGSGVETVVGGLEAPHGVVVDNGAGFLYWTDWAAHKIQRSRLDGSDVVTLVDTGNLYPRFLVVDAAAGFLYWTGDGVGQIWYAPLAGGTPAMLVPGEGVSSRGLALDLENGRLFWSEATTRRVLRVDLDGGNEKVLVWPRVFDPQSLQLDLVGGKMYWADVETNMIMRSDLDGLNLEPVIATGLETPTGLALDVVAGKLYWADWGTGEIGRANLDGSGVEILLTAADGLQRPNHVTLDFAARKLYWTDFGTGMIHRANLDGMAVELVLDGLGILDGLALDQAMPGTYRFLLPLIE